MFNGNISPNNQNCKIINIPSLNLFLKKSNNGTLECEQTKLPEKPEKTFKNCKTNEFILKNKNKKSFIVPQIQGSLTLEKEENNNYYPYFCFKNKKE